MEKRHVIIVEDEALIAGNINHKLETIGFCVDGIFQSGKAVLEYIEATRPLPDLVLMDILLNDGEDGIDVAAKIHKTTDIPIIFLSALNDQQTIRRATNAAKPFNYLVKPFSGAELQTTIEIAFQRAELERKLKESEKRYKIISELSSDFAYAVQVVHENQFRVEWVTEAVSAITGYSREDILQGIDHDSILLDEEKKHIQRFVNALLRGESKTLEHRILSKDGTIRWICNKAEPEVDETTGKVMRIYGTVEDISELKRIEDIEKSKEQNFQVLMKRMNEGVLILDKKGIITFVNDLTCSMTGYEKYELIGEPVLALSNKSDKLVADSRTGENPFETTLMKKSGDSMNVLVSPKILHNGKGEFAGNFLVVTNIDKQKEKEYSLYKQRDVFKTRYESIFNSIRVPLIEKDLSETLRLVKEKQKKVKNLPRYLKRYKDFTTNLFSKMTCSRLNRAAAELFKIQDCAEYQDRFLNLLLPETFAFFREALIEMINGKRHIEGEIPIYDSEENILYIQVDVYLSDTVEGPKHCVFSFNDITERYQQAKLQQGEELYKCIIDASPVAMILSDENRNIVYVSKKVGELFRLKNTDEIIGKSIIAWIARNDQLRAIENIKKVYQGTSNVNRYTLLRSDKTTFLAEIISTTLADKPGNTMNMLSTIREILPSEAG